MATIVGIDRNHPASMPMRVRALRAVGGLGLRQAKDMHDNVSAGASVEVLTPGAGEPTDEHIQYLNAMGWIVTRESSMHRVTLVLPGHIVTHVIALAEAAGGRVADAT